MSYRKYMQTRLSINSKIAVKPGDWVLLKGDSVLACGRDVKRLIRMYDRLRSDDIVITKEPAGGHGHYLQC